MTTISIKQMPQPMIYCVCMSMCVCVWVNRVSQVWFSGQFRPLKYVYIAYFTYAWDHAPLNLCDTFNEPHNVRPNAFAPLSLSLSTSPLPPSSLSHTIIAGAAVAVAPVVVWCKQALGTNMPLFINVLISVYLCACVCVWTGKGKNYIIFAFAPILF